MSFGRTVRFGITLVVAGFCISVAGGPADEESAHGWPQWGGPTRDFHIRAQLDPGWGDDGPRLLWKRSLGDGESAVLVEGDRLYVSYRDNENEVLACLAASTGVTLWEHRQSAPIPDSLYVKHGQGPHATPVLVGNRLCAIGIAGALRCLDKASGQLLWAHDLLDKFAAKPPDCGYAGSPLAYGKTLIVPVGGEGHGLVAFSLETGSVVWQSTDFGAGYAAPTLIRVGKETQVVAFMRAEVAGLDPDTGALRWHYPHPTEYGVNASMPIFGEDGLLFVSSAYDTGSRGLRLSADGRSVREVWRQRKLQIHFNNALRIGQHIYGTSGDFGPVLLTAVRADNGEIAWQKRDIVSKATLLRVGERVLAIDEKGKIALLGLSPQGVTVHAEHQLVNGRVWAPPTLAGNLLLVRNRTHLHAFELASSRAGELPEATRTERP